MRFFIFHFNEVPDPFAIQNQDDSIKDNRVEDYYDKSLEGGFLFGGDEDSGSLRFFVSRKRIVLFFGIAIFCLLVLWLRFFYLQGMRGSYYRNIAEGNRVRMKHIRANRGVILDRDYKLLARNIPHFSLFFIPADLPEDEIEKNRILNTVAGILEKSILELESLVERAWKFSFEPILIAEDINFEKAMLLEIESKNLAGIFLETVARREYTEAANGLAHILGYTGKLTEQEFGVFKKEGYLISDYLGKTGVEKTYEELLRGEYGKKSVEVDFLGKEENVLSFREPVAGKDIVLAIDWDLQKRASEALESELERKRLNKGVVIVMGVETGQILSLVSLPDYDNNLFVSEISGKDYQGLVEDENRPLFNRAISGEYPPGSTFKLVMAGGALEDEIIDEKTHVFSTGGISINEWFFPDWKYGGHGRVTVTKAIADSVNTFFYYVGGGYEDFLGLGVDRINHWAYIFGLGQELGIDLVGEEDGFLPTKQWKLKYKNEPWYIGDTYHLAIGQGDVLVTPLQVANYTSAIANGGILYQPQVIMAYLENNNETYLSSKIIRKDFVSKENLAIVKEGMRDAVIYGSSRGLENLNVEVAGKTGTAQVGGEAEPHAWFTGFAPYSEPEIVITILVENGGDGSRVAVPIAREVLRYYFNKRGRN